MASNTTPGPWYVLRAANGSAVSVRAAGNAATVALLKSDHPDTKGRKLDNARLIAAAPELLAALIEAADALEAAGQDYSCLAARAAIAKATGGAA